MSTHDQLLTAKLSGNAWRLAAAQGPIAEAVAELRGLAAGRNDLLAETAGLVAGSWSANPAMHTGTELLAAGLLIHAGHPLDYDALATAVAEGQRRGGEAGWHTTR